jgi:tetratricopeptide (TPR) repeat protein
MSPKSFSLARLLLTAGFLGFALSVPLPAADEDRDRQLADRLLETLEKNPRRGAVLDRVYGHHVERGTLDELLQRYRQRTAKDPKDGAAWMLLGLFEAQRGQEAKAVEAFRQAEATRPDDALAPYYLGQALVLVGKPDLAVEAFERALARKPANRQDLLEVFQALGRLHQRAQRRDQALAVWNRLEAAFPDNVRVQEQIATILAEEGQHDQALARFEALAAKSPDRGRQAQFRIEAAELKVRLGRTADALKDLEDLLGRLDANSWLHREVRRKIEEVFLRDDNLAGLATYYEGWVGKHPEDVDARAALARARAQQGRLPEARAALEQALKLAPSRKELRQALIDQLVHEQKVPDALAQYEALDKIDPNNPDRLRAWGLLILQDESRPEAERRRAAAAVWERLTQARPGDSLALVQVADLLRQAGMTDEALAHYRKAVELAPDAPQYREYLGEFYHGQKRADEALATWREMAAGPRRSAKNLARLSEVLAGFGYLEPALAALADASSLEKDDASLRLRTAELLHQAGRYPDALRELAAAERLASGDDEAEEVLRLEVKTLEATNELTACADTLQKELDAGRDATAPRWYRLARYREAERRPADATAAVTKALALDAASVRAWTAAARIHEEGGNLLAAADAHRRLAALDRHTRTQHLQQVAQLEARLGRRDQALEVGRDLVKETPNNPEAYQFLAGLCNQLGESEEALAVLRKAVLVNRDDPHALQALANALAERFRTGEAIELYWRAYDRAGITLEDRLALLPRLTELHLQTNQFDRLLERLQRDVHQASGPERRRQGALCVAQAYQSAGDLGAARRQLEPLLGDNPRDTQLLRQLSGLAESEADLAGAIKYQRQLAQVAPGKEEEGRLAQLLVRAGETEEAGAIWVRLAGQEKEFTNVLLAAQHLLANGKPDAALTLTTRALQDHPRDWEALYLEGVALERGGRPAEAERRFQAILDLRLPDDELSIFQKGQKPAARRPSPRPGAAAPVDFPLQDRLSTTMQIWQATGLNPTGYPIYFSSQATFWTPADFGQARLGALGWLLALAQKEKKQDEFVAKWRQARERAGQDERTQLDWVYLLVLRQDQAGLYDATRGFARSPDPALRWLYLAALMGRNAAREVRVYPGRSPTAADTTPPLPGADLDEMLACFRSLQRQRPEWVIEPITTGVLAELKRAGRSGDVDAIYRDTLTAAARPEGLAAALRLAAERGDIDAALKLFDRLEQLPPGSPGVGDLSDALGRAMSLRADARATADVLRLLDRYLAHERRQKRTGPAARAPAGPTLNGNPYYRVWTAQGSSYVMLDYPTPNDYHDYTGISLLRTAYDLYKRDDLVSDLFRHLRAAGDAAPQGERVFYHLALGYLHWWAGEKDEALRELTRGSELAPADLNLRLEVAELRERHGEPEEALALADSITPLDHTLMQRRELLALRLAVRTRKLPRARQAAERLFGLRLDPELQVRLAGQMRQLGMDDLAEAVLARAQGQAGNRTAVLVSLMLQFQSQNPDAAAQVAYQILRHGPSQQVSPNGRTEEDTARAQALDVLARSGKLQALIQRAEAQLRSAPRAAPLYQTLAEYYRAAGARDKSRQAYERLAELRPDDARLRYQLAGQLYTLGETKAAADQYAAALRKDPTLFAQQSFQILQVFQQNNRMEELADILDKLDARALGYSFAVTNLVDSLLQNEKTRAVGVRLFRKGWQAFPSQRLDLLTQSFGGGVWQLPEIFDYLHQAVLPAEGDRLVNPWAAASAPIFGAAVVNDGRMQGLMTRLLDTAAAQNRLGPLAGEVDQALAKHPDWASGRVLRAALLARAGKDREAREVAERLLADRQNPMPANACRLLAQELEPHPPLKDLAVRFYEAAVAEALASPGETFSQTAAPRLVALYREARRDADAHALILKFVRRQVTGGRFDNEYEAYQRLRELEEIAALLLQLGHPVDALRTYNDILSDPQRITLASRFAGGRTARQVAEQGRAACLRALRPEVLPSVFREFLAPTADGGKAPALDLLLVADPPDLRRGRLVSMLGEALRLAGGSPSARVAVRDLLDGVRRQAPDDLSAAVAAALAALAEDRAEGIDAALNRLLKLAEAQPLEELPAGTPANSRQRQEAARQIGLWLVARECLRRPDRRAVAERLAARAVEAAGRQADRTYALVMWGEWGRLDLERGDRAAAERHWTAMLDLVLGAGRPATPATGPAVVDLEQFGQAMQVAKLAAEHGLHALSLRAVHETLAAGPPLVLLEDQPARRVSPSGVTTPADPALPFRTVEENLSELSTLWLRQQAPAGAVYEALATAVLPERRADEVFLYPRPLALTGTAARVGSGGQLLAEWAVRAGRAAELRQRLQARQEQARAALPARVLLTQLALAGRDYPAATQALDWLGRRLPAEKARAARELTCHAALPALDVPETAAAAVPVLREAARGLAAPATAEPAGSLLLLLARFSFDHADQAEGRKHLREYLDLVERANARSTPAVVAALRKTQLHRAAAEFGRAGLFPDALEVLGQYADIPRSATGDASLPQLDRPLGRYLAALPADQRYALLKAWTLPAGTRQSVRLYTTLARTAEVPAVFDAARGLTPAGPGPDPTADDGVLDFATLLLGAAREVGKLDELAAEVRKAADARAVNADYLLLRAEIARGRAEAVEPQVRQRLTLLNRAPLTPAVVAQPPSWEEVQLACACLRDPRLRALGAEMTRIYVSKLRNQAGLAPSAGPISRALAAAFASGEPGRAAAGPGLALWHPGAFATAVTDLAGSPPSWWVGQDGHVAHLVGPAADFLLFDYPLTGSFDFTVDYFDGLGLDGRVAYAGLMAQPGSQVGFSRVWAVGADDHRLLPTHFFRENASNRLTLQVRPGSVRFLIDGHLFYEEKDPSPTSPWLALHTFPERPTVFRGMTLTGNPQIPRTVPLTHGDRLDGWVSSFYAETRPPRLGAGRTDENGRVVERLPGADDYDWASQDGVIHGRRTARGLTAQSLLYYHRPLRSGEAVRYEFYYEPDGVMVHPALGRVAFLLAPDGIREHWLTAAAVADRTGLPPDNAVAVASHRRGPERLPLQAGAWNVLRLVLDADTLSMELNGVKVYERPLERGGDRVFGLFHYKDRSAARVRNAVLEGNWPEALTARQLANLGTRAEGEAGPGRARTALIGEAHVQLDSADLLRRARQQAPPERYASLLAWVLPGPDHEAFRLYGDFAAGGGSTGGTLEAPALELVSTAGALGKLDELAEKAAAAPAATPVNRRGQRALLALVRAAQGRDADARALIEELTALAREVRTEDPAWERWPEVVAAAAALDRPALRPAALALLDQAAARPPGGLVELRGAAAALWEPQVRCLRARLEVAALPEPPPAPYGTDPRLAYWSPVSHPTAITRALGAGVPHWTCRDGAVTHYPGHADDAFYFRVPLRGNFEVRCELTCSGRRQASLAYAGVALELLPDGKSIRLARRGRPAEMLPLASPLEKLPAEGWCACRLAVADGTLRLVINDRTVYEERLPAEPDPWLAVHVPASNTGGVRRLTITGRPVIPESLVLAGGADLGGWLADYYPPSVFGPTPAWEKRGEEIVGHRDADAPGSDRENLLRYHRPLLEDGAIEYEFYYEPGKALVHPALDRLAFLLEPDGVRVHTLTDGAYERTGLAPDNRTTEPANRRGPATLPLAAGGWNRLKLVLEGERVSVWLNDTAVYQRALEPGSPRLFGLFHFADVTEARVRNVRYRGNWPRALPDPERLLAGSADLNAK